MKKPLKFSDAGRPAVPATTAEDDASPGGRSPHEVMEGWKNALISGTRANTLLHLSEEIGVDVGMMGALSEISTLILLRDKPVCLWDARAPSFNRALLQQPGNYPASPDALEGLRSLHLQTENLLQAQDVSALYLALGVLTWSGAESGEAFRSPLLLAPVTLERRGEGMSYVLIRAEQQIEVNPLLKHLLAQEGSGFVLPLLPEEAYLVVPSYLSKVADSVGEREGWGVEARCLLGRFPLLRMRLFEDLEEHGERVQSHPFVRALAGDAAALGELPAVQPPPDDSQAQLSPSPFQLLDADPDQERAIQAAVHGQSFVLQGPPGTGKTQTITNIIGECLASGKSVLLVSGRVSSLEAVHQRLTEKGLGDLCLTAHSDKTNKRDIFQQLSQSLKPLVTNPAPGVGATKLSAGDLREVEILREELDGVTRELHRVREPLGVSLYDAYGSIAREEGRDPRRNEWARHLAAKMRDAGGVSRSEYRRREELVARLASHPLWACIPGSAVWYGAFDRPLSAPGWAGLQRALGDTLGALYRVLHAAASLSHHCGLEPPRGPREVEQLLGFVRLLLDASPYAVWLLGESNGDDLTMSARLSRYREQAEQLSAWSATLQVARDLLLERYSAAILRLPPSESDELVERLMRRQEGILLPLLGDDWRDAAVTAAGSGGLCETLDSLKEICELLQEEAFSLATACGVSRGNISTVLAPSDDLRTLLGVASEAAELPPVCAGWLVSRDAVSRRAALCEEAETHWKQWEEQAARLFPVYEAGVLALDHAELLEGLAATPTGFNRLVNRDALRSRRALQALRKPGAPAAERDAVADLELARQATLTRQWCDENAADLRETFGAYYRDGATDWNFLRGLLRIAENLCAASGPGGLLIGNAIGAVPFALVSRIAEPGGGGGVEALRSQTEGITELLGRWETLQGRLAESAGAMPPPDADFSQIAAWCDAHSRAAREQRDAVREAAFLRLPASTVPRGRDDFPSVAALVADREEACRLQATEAELIAASTAHAPDLCGPFFPGDPVRWETVAGRVGEAERLYASFEERGQMIPPALLRLLAEDDAKTERSALLMELLTLKQEWEGMSSVLGELTARFLPAYARVAEQPLGDVSFSDLTTWLEARQFRADQAHPIQALLALRQEYRVQGLGELFDGLGDRSGEVLPEHLGVSVFRSAFHRAWVESVVAEIPVLQSFNGADYRRKSERFCVLDRQLLDGAPGKILQTIKGTRQKQPLRNEVNLLTGQLARRRVGEVRPLLAQIPNLLLALKPCVMMNPLSVRLFLDPAALTFDIVLFDDASQIATEEALGAISRGRQVIIAGDSHQLPPMPLMAEVHGVRESILDSANALVAHGSPAFQGMGLNWHYRSRNESLIAYSRRHFYPELVTFPSASRRSALEELTLPGTDDADARSVIDAVLAYIRREPTHSVGVVVLDEVTQIRLFDEITRRETDAGSDAAAEVKVLRAIGSEGFFVKTIENVQGDERDMVLLFVPADPARWETLNRPGAHLLLNVAATRARHHMILATSLHPAATAEPSSPAGVMLGQFLEVVREAVSGNHGSLAEPPGAAHQAVARTLEEQGGLFEPNVGVPGCRVDFAVSNADQPQSYALGILCDGTAYAGGGTARQRDRQFPDMMRERGWNLHRVWSADCHREPEAQRLSIEAACRAATGREA